MVVQRRTDTNRSPPVSPRSSGWLCPWWGGPWRGGPWWGGPWRISAKTRSGSDHRRHIPEWQSPRLLQPEVAYRLCVFLPVMRNMSPRSWAHSAHTARQPAATPTNKASAAPVLSVSADGPGGPASAGSEASLVLQTTARRPTGHLSQRQVGGHLRRRQE